MGSSLLARIRRIEEAREAAASVGRDLFFVTHEGDDVSGGQAYAAADPLLRGAAISWIGFSNVGVPVAPELALAEDGTPWRAAVAQLHHVVYGYNRHRAADHDREACESCRPEPAPVALVRQESEPLFALADGEAAAPHATHTPPSGQPARALTLPMVRSQADLARALAPVGLQRAQREFDLNLRWRDDR